MTDTPNNAGRPISTLLRDPLVHFIVIGLALFPLHAILSTGEGDKTIVITQAMADDARAQHQKLWGRQPTPVELKNMLEVLANDEMVYREGVALGLDRDDAVIKRRVRVKYELIAEEAESAAPDDGDLEAYLKAHPDRFRAPPALTFTQVLLPETDGPEKLKAAFEKMKSALDAGAAPESVGQRTLLPARAERLSLDAVARDFGEKFAVALADMPVGTWLGPVVSGYGLHIVRLEAKTPSTLPPLASIRQAVQRDWEDDRRRKARAARVAELRNRYDVIFEVAP
jgi:hypothetical protein